MARSDLPPLRVFIVEDESLVAMLIEDMLVDMGCTVAGLASGLDDALQKASSLSFDVAILDVNLNGARTFPLAEELARNRKPFVFSTGYGASSLPEGFQHIPVLGKPFQENELRNVLADALERASAS